MAVQVLGQNQFETINTILNVDSLFHVMKMLTLFIFASFLYVQFLEKILCQMLFL